MLDLRPSGRARRRRPRLRGSTRPALAALTALAALAVAAPTAGAVSGAAFTTVNEAVDGAGHCKNGNPAVNCNIYDGKQFVWLNGGPAAAALGDGTYFFAVLVPGGQPDPNDGGAKNLSDGANGRFDTRTFSVANGTISYPRPPGTHHFDDNKIRLMPYDDTTNPGGVYIMAICSLAQGYPVNPSTCKYDAFKVREGEVAKEDLAVEKTAAGTFKRTFDWTVAKTVDGQPSVSYNAATKTLSYQVVYTKTGPTKSDFAVSGDITVTNPNAFDVPGVNVSDTLNDAAATSCQVADGKYTDADGLQRTVSAASGTLRALTTVDYAYSCSPADDTATENTATVAWTDFGSPNASAQASAPVTWTATTVHDCVDVSDTNTASGAPSGRICGSQTFLYTLTVTPDANRCTTVDNTAAFVAVDDSEHTRSSSASARVCAPIANGFTLGFWSNKNGEAALNACPGGGMTPALAYLSSLYLVDGRGNDFNPTSYTQFKNWLLAADATNMSYMLSAQMAATALNVRCQGMDGTAFIAHPLTGAPVRIADLILEANAFLATNKNTTKSGAARDKATAYKNAFDNLNNNRVFAVV
jgi:hypothetical protein